MRRYAFWPLALLWLPTGFAVQAVVRFGPRGGPWADAAMWLPMAAQSLGRRGAYWAAAGAGMPPLMATGLPADSLDGGGRPWHRDGGGGALRGAARTRGDRGLRHDPELARVDRLFPGFPVGPGRPDIRFPYPSEGFASASLSSQRRRAAIPRRTKRVTSAPDPASRNTFPSRRPPRARRRDRPRCRRRPRASAETDGPATRVGGATVSTRGTRRWRPRRGAGSWT